jgi:hypothetical protein
MDMQKLEFDEYLPKVEDAKVSSLFILSSDGKFPHKFYLWIMDLIWWKNTEKKLFNVHKLYL